LLRYNEDELLKKAQESMLSPKWKVLKVAKVNLPDDEEIYVGEIQAGRQKSHLLPSSPAGRPPVIFATPPTSSSPSTTRG